MARMGQMQRDTTLTRRYCPTRPKFKPQTDHFLCMSVAVASAAQFKAASVGRRLVCRVWLMVRYACEEHEFSPVYVLGGVTVIFAAICRIVTGRLSKPHRNTFLCASTWARSRAFMSFGAKSLC